MKKFFIGPVRDADRALVSKEYWNVALCLCYQGLLKHSLWNHLGSSCLLLHQNLVCEILSYSGISMWLGWRKTWTEQAKLSLSFLWYVWYVYDAAWCKNTQMIWTLKDETLAFTYTCFNGGQSKTVLNTSESNFLGINCIRPCSYLDLEHQGQSFV